MNDDEFLIALETCTLPPDQFGHTAHVRAAYLYSRNRHFADALARMTQSIRAYARHLGKADKYHETIAVAFLALIQRHLVETGDAGGWDAFSSRHQGRFDVESLLRFYSPEQLNSELARKVFVLPCPPPVGS